MHLFIVTVCAELPDWVGKSVSIENELIKLDRIDGMVFIRGGCFDMGHSDEHGESTDNPLHNVCVDDFYIGSYEVSKKEWQKLMKGHHSHFEEDCNDCAEGNVSWNDVQEFIVKLNKQTGKKYRLPTEAEWEYAARSRGRNEKFAGTNDIQEVYEYVWFSPNSDSSIHQVGGKKPNSIGLYDMNGNVSEWVSDWYKESYYKNSPKDNPKGPNKGSSKVLRGGSSNDYADINGNNYVRYKYSPQGKNKFIGFRLALSPVSGYYTTKESLLCHTAAELMHTGNALLKIEPVKAETLYREALGKCPESINARYNIALSLYNQHRSPEAVSILSDLLNSNPDHKGVTMILAYILLKEKIDPAGGIKLFKKILETNTEDESTPKIFMLLLTESVPSLLETTVLPIDKQITSYGKVPSDVDTNISTTKMNNPDAIAIILGNKDYDNKDIPSVSFAINDAETIRKYLINVLGYKEENILYETNATKGNFEKIFGTKDDFKGRLYEYLKKGKSDIFIYYSGHGAPDIHSRQGYLVPYDADINKISLTGYSLKQMFENVARISKEMNVPNVFIVFDSCFSGMSEGGALLKNISPIGIVVDNPLLTMPNATVMTSSSGSEVSSWYPDKGHGMFTYFFLKALKKGAEKDGEIKLTIGDIFKHITDENEGLPYYARKLHGRVQTPQIMGNSGRIILEKLK